MRRRRKKGRGERKNSSNSDCWEKGAHKSSKGFSMGGKEVPFNGRKEKKGTQPAIITLRKGLAVIEEKRDSSGGVRPLGPGYRRKKKKEREGSPTRTLRR